VSLAAEALRLRLGGEAVLDGVDAALRRGEVTAVLGPNGAGKSTLLGCLAGLRRPDQGTVRLDGTLLADLAPRARARRIGYLPQSAETAWPIEARILVGLGRTPFIGARGLSAEDAAAIDAALAAAGAGELAGRIVTTLSGGERARVLIARALAGEPDWLLADEPLTGLDPGHQLDAAELFRALARERGCGVVVTLHDLSLAARMADRVLVLAQGRILADGAPGEALSPDVLARAYGIRTQVGEGVAGPLIEVIGRSGPDVT
jgi:iron complex transport system ATP-binding protein